MACEPDLHPAKDQSYTISLMSGIVRRCQWHHVTAGIKKGCHGWMVFTHDCGLSYPCKEPIRHHAWEVHSVNSKSTFELLDYDEPKSSTISSQVKSRAQDRMLQLLRW